MVVVNFWATWCGPCKLEILAVTTEDDAVVREFIKEKGYTFPILLDPGGVVTEQYGVEAFPTTVLVGPSGNVTRYWKGINPALEREITQALGQRGRSRPDGTQSAPPPDSAGVGPRG